ncbi:sugar ABC transporter ATP-binding protein [Clostridiaceae bacterium 35-E11]
MSSEYLLEMKHIEKDFYGNQVVKDVNIRVRPGEIVALIGENGAGKSTIMNILFGMPAITQTGGYKGKVLLDGKEILVKSPVEAMNYGIGMVHQEFMLIDGYNVAENIKLNREVTKKNIVSRLFGKSMETVDKKSMKQEAKVVLDSLNIDLNENARVGSLSVGYKQFVEIARELDKKKIKLIVLDEPTAVLTETESEQFLRCVREVAAKGISFIFISHKLEEIVNNTNHVFVLRDGEMVGDYDTSHLTAVKMSELMVGRKVEIINRVIEKKQDAPIEMELKNFSVKMPGEICKGVNLQIKKGEIFGIGGLAGHGKISIANGIIGMYPSTGQVVYKDQVIDTSKTKDNLEKGIAFVSEDRRGAGLMLDESIELNMVIASLKIKNGFMKKVCGMSFYNKKESLQYAKKLIKELDIRCTGSDQAVKNLSGGNQQKVCIARALILNPEILFISEPTRGIDIGAKKMILDYLLYLNQEKGMTIVITSSELAELRSICGRIAIITEGQVAGILKNNDPDYKFGLLMSGSKDISEEVVI